MTQYTLLTTTLYRKKSEKARSNLVKMIMAHNTSNKIHTLKTNDALNKCQILLTAKATKGSEKAPPSPIECPLCHHQFSSRFKFTQHLKTNIDCNLLHQIEKFTPLKCSNKNCNECCANNNDLQKHLLYHCHLTQEERISLQFLRKRIILTEEKLNKSVSHLRKLTCQMAK